MTANKVVVVSVLLYTVLFVVSAIVFFNTKFTGSDAAGNGMASGLTFLFGLAVLFVIALIVTVVNAFFFKNISRPWIKVLVFIPLLLPLVAFGYEFLEIGKYSKVASIPEQERQLTLQIRTTEKLNSPKLSLVSSVGFSSGDLVFKQKTGAFYLYEGRNAISIESERSFYISSDRLLTQEHLLDIPDTPKTMPYTPWEKLSLAPNSTRDSLQLEFRYSIAK